MVSQTKCQIAESLGDMLSRSRQEMKLTPTKVSARLGIPEKWILRIEADQWSEIPEDAYSRIYFRSYCRLLGLDTKTMIELYRGTRLRHRLNDRQSTKARRHHPTTAVPAWQTIVTTRLIRRGLLGLLGLGLIGYFWWAIAGIITPPKIALIAPVDGLVTEDRSVVVEGRTESEVGLQVNGKSISPDGNGYFRDTLELAEGLNLIKVTASKRHSKETVVTRRIIVKPPEKTAALLHNQE